MEAPRSIRYIILGEPVAWKRPAGRTVRYDSQKDTKLMFGFHIRNQHQGPLFTGPVHLEILFAMPIPVKMSDKKRQALHGAWHSYAPDNSNMIKLVEDAAQSILYDNDCIIACITSFKKYDLNPRTEFTLTELR